VSISILLIVTGLVSLSASSARAEPFDHDDLFFGRAVKQSTAWRRFDFQLRLDLAPGQAVSRVVIQGFRRDHPEIDPLFDYLFDRSVDIDQMGTMGADGIRSELLGIDGLSPTDRASIEGVFDNASPQELQAIERGVHDLGPLLNNKEEAISFAITPRVVANFDVVQVTVELPLAGFVLGGTTDFTVGNLGLDARFGHTFGDNLSFGLTYGLAVYAPTAGARASSLGYQNPLVAPSFFQEYLTIAPYIAIGLDVGIVQLHSYVECIDAIGVRGDPDNSQAVALRYGVAAILDIASVFAVNVELDGAKSILSGEAFEALSLTGGLRADLFGFTLGLGVHVPVALMSGDRWGSSTETLVSAAAVDVVLTLGFGF